MSEDTSSDGYNRQCHACYICKCEKCCIRKCCPFYQPECKGAQFLYFGRTTSPKSCGFQDCVSDMEKPMCPVPPNLANSIKQMASAMNSQSDTPNCDLMMVQQIIAISNRLLKNMSKCDDAKPTPPAIGGCGPYDSGYRSGSGSITCGTCGMCNNTYQSAGNCPNCGACTACGTPSNSASRICDSCGARNMGGGESDYYSVRTCRHCGGGLDDDRCCGMPKQAGANRAPRAPAMKKPIGACGSCGASCGGTCGGSPSRSANVNSKPQCDQCGNQGCSSCNQQQFTNSRSVCPMPPRPSPPGPQVTQSMPLVSVPVDIGQLRIEPLFVNFPVRLDFKAHVPPCPPPCPPPSPPPCPPPQSIEFREVMQPRQSYAPQQQRSYILTQAPPSHANIANSCPQPPSCYPQPWITIQTQTPRPAPCPPRPYPSRPGCPRPCPVLKKEQPQQSRCPQPQPQPKKKKCGKKQRHEKPMNCSYF